MSVCRVIIVFGLYCCMLLILSCNSMSNNSDSKIRPNSDSMVPEYTSPKIVDSSTIVIPRINMINKDIIEKLQHDIIPFLKNNAYTPEKRMLRMDLFIYDENRMMSFGTQPLHIIRLERAEYILGYFYLNGYHVLVYDRICLSSIERKKLFVPTSQSIKMKIIDGVLSGPDGPSWIYELNDSLQPIPYQIKESW